MNMRYWVDEVGDLWLGAVAPNSIYAKLYGFDDGGLPCWVSGGIEEPDAANEITADQAAEIISARQNARRLP